MNENLLTSEEFDPNLKNQNRMPQNQEMQKNVKQRFQNHNKQNRNLNSEKNVMNQNVTKNLPQQIENKNETDKEELNTRKPNLKIMFLGGIGEIGKNMTVFEYGNDIMIVDAGLMFPNDDMLGIDLVVPDITYLLENKNRIRGIVLTHGHEDHIGGLPYVLNDLNIPLYGTKMTLALVSKKLDEHKKISYKANAIKPGQSIKLGVFEIEFIHVNHSIAGAVALGIKTPIGNIVHTGDFKIDFTPTHGSCLDMAKFSEYGEKGTLLLMADSTNAERAGMSMSESLVKKTIESLFIENATRRITVATFASNVYRLQVVMDLAQKYGRKVVFTGRSMINISDAATKIGEMNFDKNNLIEIEQIKNYADKELCVISTGSQGEPMSALVRMGDGEFKGLEMGENDTIIFSSSPIPGNEKMVNNVINKLIALGANVIYNQLEQVHASGHACQDELRIIFSLVKPKFFMPVHGELKHLKSNKSIAMSMGIEERNILLPMLGMEVQLNKNSLKATGTVPYGSRLIDGAGVGEMQSNVLKERKQLSEDGLCIVILNINSKQAKATRAEIISRGFTYIGEAESWLNEAKDNVLNSLADIDLSVRDYVTVKQTVRKSLSNFLSKKLKRRPLIIPILIES